MSGNKLILAMIATLLSAPVYAEEWDIVDKDGNLEAQVSGDEFDYIDRSGYSSVFSPGGSTVKDLNGNYSGRIGRDGSIYGADGSYKGKIK